jgi:hypothetical protein
LRFCLAQIRAEVEALPGIGKAVKKLIMDSIAAVLHREHRAGRLQPGRRLGVFIDELCALIAGLPGEDLWDGLRDLDREDEWRVLSWAFWRVGETQRFVQRVCA